MLGIIPQETHIHQPQIRTIERTDGNVIYLNSGDWIENLSALEYYDGQWHLFEYKEVDFAHEEAHIDEINDPTVEKLMAALVNY